MLAARSNVCLIRSSILNLTSSLASEARGSADLVDGGEYPRELLGVGWMEPAWVCWADPEGQQPWKAAHTLHRDTGI